MNITLVQDRYDTLGDCHTENITYADVTGLAINSTYKIVYFIDSAGKYHLFPFGAFKELIREL